MLSVIRTVSEFREQREGWAKEGVTVGFVPTMGALHEGHASLVRASLGESDRSVVSIFVNPLQFDRREDLETYPESLEADMELLEGLGVDCLLHPGVDEMYSGEIATSILQEGLTSHLCGASRPGHFDGVLAVVARLFNVVQPHFSYFGQKDYQQSAIIRRMVEDLNYPITVRVMPIIREEDGLALSSRNRLLSGSHRASAPGIRSAMLACDRSFRDGLIDVEVLKGELIRILSGIPGGRVEYVEICDPDTLVPRESGVLPGDLLAVAVFMGEVRLIDNLLLGLEERP